MLFLRAVIVSSPFRASGRKLEKFTVSVNVAAGSKVTFELTYEELLKRHKEQVRDVPQVQPKQLVKHFEVIGHCLHPLGDGVPERALGRAHRRYRSQAPASGQGGMGGYSGCPPHLGQGRRPDCTWTIQVGCWALGGNITKCFCNAGNWLLGHFYLHQNAKPKEMLLDSGAPYGRGRRALGSSTQLQAHVVIFLLGGSRLGRHRVSSGWSLHPLIISSPLLSWRLGLALSLSDIS